MNTNINAKLIHTIDVKNTLGEGIQWLAERNEIWWTDIGSNQLFCLNWNSIHLSQYSMPEAVGSFAFIEGNDDILLIAFASGIAYYSLKTEQIDWLYKNITDTKTSRLNDGRVDRQGRFWVGSMSKLDEEYSTDKGRAQLFCLDSEQKLHIREDNIHISNGTCWSPDGKTMYFADSPRGELYRYQFDIDTGKNTKRELFQRTADGVAPDGACIDSEGFLWSAHWGAGKVVRYHPSGEINAEVSVPASQVSCVAFGGENLNLLLVTSARTGLSNSELEKDKEAGQVFIYETNITGLPENKYSPKYLRSIVR